MLNINQIFDDKFDETSKDRSPNKYESRPIVFEAKREINTKNAIGCKDVEDSDNTALAKAKSIES